MRIFHFFLRNHKNCLCNGSWTSIRTNFYSNCLLETPLKYLKFNLVRSFLIYHSLFKNNLRIQSFGDEDGSQEKVRGAVEKKKSQKVSIINKKNQEIVMELVDAEKYAKRMKMRLVPVDGTAKDKIKYKLVNIVEEVIQDKKHKPKDLKRVFLREEIAAHDLEIKMNQMLKLLNKGSRVMCLIEGSSGGEKMNNIMSTLEKSELKEFFVEKTKRSRGVQLIYQRKTCDEEKKNE